MITATRFRATRAALLTSLAPTVWTAGGPRVHTPGYGRWFRRKTVIQWNGKTIATTVNTDSAGNVLSVTALVPAVLTATPGKAFVNTIESQDEQTGQRSFQHHRVSHS